jgi:hypothetical protein
MLPSGQKRPLFVTSLYYSAKVFGNDRAVGITLAPSGRKQPLQQKILSVPFLKKLKTGISF